MVPALTSTGSHGIPNTPSLMAESDATTQMGSLGKLINNRGPVVSHGKKATYQLDRDDGGDLCSQDTHEGEQQNGLPPC